MMDFNAARADGAPYMAGLQWQVQFDRARRGWFNHPPPTATIETAFATTPTSSAGGDGAATDSILLLLIPAILAALSVVREKTGRSQLLSPVPAGILLQALP